VSHPGSTPRIGIGVALVVRFGPADVGRRITLRRRLPDVPPGEPDLGDVVGVLESWIDGVLSLRRRTGEVVQVPAATVVAGRVVAPELSAAALSEVADETWRAHESARIGDWRLRWHDDVTHRPNSVLAVGDPGLPVDEALDAAVRWYAERGATAAVMTPVPAPITEVCAARGWRQERRTQVLAAATADLAAVTEPERTDGVRVVLTPDLPDDWPAVLPGLQNPPTFDRYRELLTSTPNVAFATARDSAGEPLAVARGAVASGWMNLTNIEVLPTAQRRGLGAALPLALARWSLEQRATHAFLQVWPDNDVALRLYGRLGFTLHHEYAYCVPPA
jgi:ribosomal protein S18 acetylase RimI-like enzyme